MSRCLWVLVAAACRPAPGSAGSPPGGSGTSPPSTARPATILAADCAQQPDNVLRYDCTVELDRPAAVEVEVEEAIGANPRVRSDDRVATTHVVTLFRLAPDTAYRWAARVVGETDGAAGTFTTAELPAPQDLDIVITGADPGLGDLLFSTPCGGVGSLFVMDPDGRIVWYQPNPDPVAAPGFFNAFSVTPTGEVAGIIGVKRIVVFSWQGALLHHYDYGTELPHYVHHEVVEQDGVLYALTGQAVLFPDGNEYAVDGVVAIDRASGSVLQEWDAREVLDPVGVEIGDLNFWQDVLPGALDYSHANSLAVSGESWTLSLQALDVVLQVNADDVSADPSSFDWLLAGSPDAPYASDFVLESAVLDEPRFDGQHHVHWNPDGRLAMLDNGDSLRPTRAMEIALDGDRAEIVSVSPIEDSCPRMGSAFRMDDGGVLVTCGGRGEIWDLDPAGAPRWHADVTCSGSPAQLYRGVPVSLP